MGACCKITGKNELETLTNQKKWLAGWSKKLINYLEDMRNGINIVKDGLRVDDANSSQVKITKELLSSIVIPFDHYFTDEKPLDILENIKKFINEFIEESYGNKAVPVDDWNSELFKLMNDNNIEEQKVINIAGNSNYFRNLQIKNRFWEIVHQIEQLKIFLNKPNLKELILVFNDYKTVTALKDKDNFDFLFDLRLKSMIQCGNSIDKISVLEALKKKYQNLKLKFVYRNTVFTEVSDQSIETSNESLKQLEK